MKKVSLKFILFVFSFIILTCADKNKLDESIEKIDVPLGLANMKQNIPSDNKISIEKIKLGRDLFFDTRLSVDGTISCDFCHNPLLGFSDGRYFATGVYGIKSKRNTISILNRIFSEEFFWDGRAKSIEETISDHIVDPNIYGNEIKKVVDLINSDENYRNKFENVFNSEVNIDGTQKAVATFVRTLISGNSPYDKYMSGDKNALTESAIRGMNLFMSDRLKCSMCHSGPNFTDEKYHNNGTIIKLDDPDLGRYLVTKINADKYKFRTPTLRDISRSSPYMHNGSLKGLNSVIDFYDQGGIPNDYLSPLIKPLNLTNEEKEDLKSFLRSLTGTNHYFFGNN